MNGQNDVSKSDAMKMQGLLIMARFLLFLAIIALALLLLFGVLRYQMYSGGTQMNITPVTGSQLREKGTQKHSFSETAGRRDDASSYRQR